MAAAARGGDMTTHEGEITGPGVSTVLIGGKKAAVAGDMHTCPMAAPGHPAKSSFQKGSTTVMIGGRQALRITDTCGCGARATLGCPTVIIGG